MVFVWRLKRLNGGCNGAGSRRFSTALDGRVGATVEASSKFGAQMDSLAYRDVGRRSDGAVCVLFVRPVFGWIAAYVFTVAGPAAGAFNVPRATPVGLGKFISSDCAVQRAHYAGAGSGFWFLGFRLTDQELRCDLHMFHRVLAGSAGFVFSWKGYQRRRSSRFG